MSKIKLNIEVESNVYEDLKKQFASAKAKFGTSINATTVEEFITTILDSYIKSDEQIKKMGSKFTELMDMFGNGNLGDLGDLDISSLFNKKPTAKSEEKKEPKSEDNSTKLKN
jgi:hypothetical protein